MVCFVNLIKEELLVVGYLNLLMLKFIMYIVNVNENGFENNLYLDVVVEFVVKENVFVVVVCVVIEVELFEFEEEECDEFLVDFGIEELGFNCVICLGYDLFNL